MAVTTTEILRLMVDQSRLIEKTTAEMIKVVEAMKGLENRIIKLEKE